MKTANPVHSPAMRSRAMDFRRSFRPSVAERYNAAGVGLIEILVAVAILAFGMLGIAALQATALKNGQSSYERSQVVTMTYSVLDRMRTNLQVARTGGYNMARTCAVPATGDQAANDKRAWIESLHSSLGEGACGKIDCSIGSGTPIPPQKCDIAVEWNDARGSQGNAGQILTTSTSL